MLGPCLALVAQLAVLVTLPSVNPAPAPLGQNWPEFRGPTGQGIAAADHLPLTWGPDRNVAWKQAIPGKGWSTPVVWEGRVYLTTAVPLSGAAHGLSLRVLSLDGATGKVLWDQEVFRHEGTRPPPAHGKNSHASPSPLVDGERLYVHFGHLGTACLDLEGKPLWKNTRLVYDPVHGNGGSPVLVDDTLVFSADGSDQQFVAALSCKSGEVVWKTDRQSQAIKKFSFSTPLVIRVKDRTQIVSPASEFVAAYDASTGREVWRVRYEGYSVVPRPVTSNGLVFLSSGYDNPTVLAIRPDGVGDVTETHVVWKTRKGAPLTPSPVAAGDELYLVADNGLVSCLDAKTGRVHWQERLGGSYSASPVLAGDRLYVQSEEGIGTVLRAGTRFEHLAKNDLEERTLASYAVVVGALYVRTEKHLYKLVQK